MRLWSAESCKRLDEYQLPDRAPLIDFDFDEGKVMLDCFVLLMVFYIKIIDFSLLGLSLHMSFHPTKLKMRWLSKQWPKTSHDSFRIYIEGLMGLLIGKKKNIFVACSKPSLGSFRTASISPRFSK